MAKMNNKMIAMCSAAIGLIYGAGYFVTDPVGATSAQPSATTTIQTAQNNQQNGQGQPGTGQGPGRHHRHGFGGGDGDHGGQWGGSDGQMQGGQNGDGGQGQSQTQQAQPGNSGASANSGQSSQAPATSGSVKYKDGTYNGTGTTRIGSVTVAVTIKSNKITDVQITDCSTHYPENLIADMPQQVIQRQNANIDFVSGATLSSEDFQNAVQEALQQAQA